MPPRRRARGAPAAAKRSRLITFSVRVFTDTEKVYLASITEVLRNHGKDYPDALRVKVMGTVPINTATIIVDELGMDVSPEDLLAEFYENQIVRMVNVPFLPGTKRTTPEVRDRRRRWRGMDASTLPEKYTVLPAPMDGIQSVDFLPILVA